MKVLVDIGNSRTKYQIDQASNALTTTAENNIIDKPWLDEHWGAATYVVISSVKRGDLPDMIVSWSKNKSIPVKFINSEKKALGITNSYEKPETLGVDRWLSMVGGAKIYPNIGIVIVDAGTATTVDVIDSHGIHQGGWILSGIDLMLKQLGQHTSKVNYDISDTSNTAFGQNTSGCVNNAAWAATVSMIELGMSKAEKEFSITQCVLLGGNAEKLSKIIKQPNILVNQNLIFEGLKRY